MIILRGASLSEGIQEFHVLCYFYESVKFYGMMRAYKMPITCL